MSQPSGTARPQTLRIFLSTVVGTSIVWYDYWIFGTAAALVFGSQFFPKFSSVAGTLAAFATFAVGFIARPLGGIIVGHFGDRVGRKAMLALMLVLSGAATYLIGVLPTFDVVGVVAPLALVFLRLIQGFAIGGEWGGALLIATEHAPARRRTLFGSFTQFGVPIGVLTSTLAFLEVEGMPSDAFNAFGWRIPFLISVILVAVGLVARGWLRDAPEYVQAKQARIISNFPLAELLRRYPRNVIMGSLASMSSPAIGYTVAVYMLDYASQVLGYPQRTLLALIVVSTVPWILAILVSSLLSDRFGGKRMYLLGTAAAVLWSIPMFELVNTRNTGLALIAFVGAAVVQGLMSGPQGGLFTELFDVTVRYSGVSVAYQIGGMIGGAVTPVAATALYASFHSVTPVAWYLTMLSAVSFLGVLGLRKPAASQFPETPQAAPPGHPAATI